MNSLVFQYALPLPVLPMPCQLAESTLSMPYIIPLLSRNPQDLGHLAWRGWACFIGVNVQSKLDVTDRLTLPTNIPLLELNKMKHCCIKMPMFQWLHTCIHLLGLGYFLRGNSRGVHTLTVICSVKVSGSTFIINEIW